jgi:inner membrane protein
METKKIQDWLNSYSVKMIVVTLLALFLLIPSFWIQEIIKERIKLKDEVEKQLASQWGDKQILAGPVLNIPFTYFQAKEDGGTPIEKTAIAHFLPETLQVQSEITPDIRYRGIYKIPVYESKAKLKGEFLAPDFSKLNINPEKIKWEDAFFTVGINDLRGIKNQPTIRLNHANFNIEPGVASNDLFESGITIKAGNLKLDQIINFDIEVLLNGSSQFMVKALGKTTEIDMSSSWSNPSFVGSFLPDERKVSDKGFTAHWTVTHLNRNFPQQWINREHSIAGSDLGTELLLPVDHYQKAMRSAKYAILFIALNFIVFIFIEITNRKRIHPFQYSLVAFALLLFYALLTSIGEQIGFNLAFVISSVAITGLISWYAYTILKSLRQVTWVVFLQLGLYVFLFTILQLQDYALLMGSIGLFVILGLIMKASQKVKWYTDLQE